MQYVSLKIPKIHCTLKVFFLAVQFFNYQSILIDCLITIFFDKFTIYLLCNILFLGSKILSTLGIFFSHYLNSVVLFSDLMVII